MTLSLKHAFHSAKGDPADTTLVRPSNWNDEHLISLATSKLIGRSTAGTGVAEEIPVGTGGFALLAANTDADRKTAVGLGSCDDTADVSKPVSTAQQAALDLKEDKNSTAGLRTATANDISVLADCGKVVEMNVGSANTFTIPPQSDVAWPTNARIDLVQLGTGQTTITAGAGVVLRSRNGLKLTGQYAAASLFRRASNDWYVMGDTTS